MNYIDKEYSYSEMDKLYTKAKEYCGSEDSQYSIISTFIQNRAMRVGQKAGTRMAATAIANKAGVDKKDVKTVLKSAGRLSGVGRKFRSNRMKTAVGNTIVGSAYQGAKDKVLNNIHSKRNAYRKSKGMDLLKRRGGQDNTTSGRAANFMQHGFTEQGKRSFKSEKVNNNMDAQSRYKAWRKRNPQESNKTTKKPPSSGPANTSRTQLALPKGRAPKVGETTIIRN